ncbi:DUF1348 family protein (plasmid) [Bradyrhizobium lupini]|uniref:DUF1348 family protein n=1 Tax=Rhizobium lupini TaxID=136996 RepID=UPI003670996B
MLPRPSSPFNREAAAAKVRSVEDSWNSRDPGRVALGYSIDSNWRIRTEFLSGRAAIEEFLGRKWSRELDYRVVTELWAFTGDRIAGRFACEYHDNNGQWFRTYGNGCWEFDQNGLIRRCIESIDKQPIDEADRMFLWPLGRRPDDHPELSDFDL